MNKLIIKNLEIFAFHGVHEFEKNQGQAFYIDAVLGINSMLGFKTDKIEETLNYSNVIRVIKETFQSKKYNLIEKLAYVVAQKLFETFCDINYIDITVKKPHAPIKEKLDYVAFNLVQKRSDINE